MKNVLSKHIKDFVELAIYHKEFNNKSFVVVDWSYRAKAPA